ncbi:uncharacterized protein LOC105392854 [Plutella xylostella]|uniref:uncharacterized protein LOC105392854 n=1 Tax=Plutella xylostella TaxID=51655 RepID=UPI0020323E2C|nr:uncharacterized protein LOC105392854 [Plutella xylostella]
MEADSTTCENTVKSGEESLKFPFPVHPGNLKLYLDIIHKDGEGTTEMKLVKTFQQLGLIPRELKCPKNTPECCLKAKPARVVDRVQWCCEGCGTRVSIRTDSFFYRLACSMLQVLQLTLAWAEDADCEVAAQHFGVKHRVATQLYDKLDNLVIEEEQRSRLGGPGSVVLVEVYPDCLQRRSPDTTDHTHVHRVLMLADTNHIPTRYCLHVIKDKSANSSSLDNKLLAAEISEVLSQRVLPGSLVVAGGGAAARAGGGAAVTDLQELLKHCDVDMQKFLTDRIWRQALTVCSASRALCTPSPAPAPAPCAAPVQRYLRAAPQRLRWDDGYFGHVLALAAKRCAGVAE